MSMHCGEIREESCRVAICASCGYFEMADGGDVIAAVGFLVRRADANWEGQGGRTTLRSKRFEHDHRPAR